MMWSWFERTLYGWTGATVAAGYRVVLEVRSGTSAALCLAKRPANDDLEYILR